MRYKKVIALALIAFSLSGCSAFDKNSDAKDIISSITGEDSSESSGDTATDVTAEVEEGAEQMTENADTAVEGEGSEEALADNEDLFSSDTVNEVCLVGDTTDVFFNSVIAKMTLFEVLTGDEALEKLDSYNAVSTVNKVNLDELQGYTACAAGYTIDLSTVEGVSEETTQLQCAVKSADGEDTIVVNGKSYSNFPILYDESEGSVVSTGTLATGTIYYLIPEGCTDYQLQFGDEDVQLAIYKVGESDGEE